MSFRIWASITASYANNGTVTIGVSGNTPPTSYLWNDGNTSQNRTGLAVGNYFVTATYGSITQSLYIFIPSTYWLYLLNVQCCFNKLVSQIIGFEQEGRYVEAESSKTTAHIIWDTLQILKCYSTQCLSVSQVKTLIDKLNVCGCPQYINQYFPNFIEQNPCIDQEGTIVVNPALHIIKFSAPSYTNSDLIGRIPDTGFAVYSDNESGTLLTYPDGYNFNPVNGQIDVPVGSGNYRLIY